MFLPSLAGGGAERVFVHLANQFVDWGREIDLVLLRKEGPYLPQVDPRVRLVDLGVRLKPMGTFALARYLQHERPAVLISAMELFNAMALIAGQLARSKTPIIATSHLHLTTHARYGPRAHDRLLPFLVARLYPSCAAIVAVSEGVAEDLARVVRLSRGRIRIIHNPVVVPECSIDETMQAPHPWFRLGEPPVVVSAGRLTNQKDYSTLVSAFARVVARRPARLIILGEGPERRMLERLITTLGIQESVLMPGFVANPFAYFRTARVFVLASRWEGFGLVLAEALACGCPVISTDCPSGPAEILEHGRYGVLVPVGDAVAMAQAIETTLDSEFDRVSLIRRTAMFSVETAARRYLEVVDECMRRSDQDTVERFASAQ
jgi:glycosyltransferase involved in cell wall biosynthesis